MKMPRMLFRESGHVVRTRREGTGLGFVVLSLLILALLYGSLDWLDERAKAKSQRLAERAQAALDERFEEGRKAGHHEMLDTARAAWNAALQEGKERCDRRQP
ncbi:MAG: hypothetical protein Q8R98_23480 [Rubrivivax sp.]|nr:hypothetical protein [Rubrivivax sp.]MDP3224411.1 hypothetical protein [Rubrivivax sp.]MDP3614813.1 hypothetical protein [Rubrivivax sp.]